MNGDLHYGGDVPNAGQPALPPPDLNQYREQKAEYITPRETREVPMAPGQDMDAARANLNETIDIYSHQPGALTPPQFRNFANAVGLGVQLGLFDGQRMQHLIGDIDAMAERQSNPTARANLLKLAQMLGERVNHAA